MATTQQQWTLVDKGSVSSWPISDVSISPKNIYRYSFTISDYGFYTFTGSCPNDTFGWISDSPTAYDLTQTSIYKVPKNYIKYDDDSGGGQNFSLISIELQANKTYYLYFCLYSISAATSATITVSRSGGPPVWTLIDKGNISSWPISDISISAKNIYRYSFALSAEGRYTFTGLCSKDTFGWISGSSIAYDLTQENISNVPTGYMAYDDSEGNGNFSLTTNLEADITYYLYFGLSSTTAGSTTITVKIASWGYDFSPLVSQGNSISAINFYNKLVTAWNNLCTKRNYYGNISSKKDDLSSVSSGIIAVSNALKNRITDFNKYFVDSITIVNQGDILNPNTANDIYSYFARAGLGEGSAGTINCKIACTGFCTSTNSHHSQASTSYTCNACDSGCSGDCGKSACTGKCYGSCDGGCDGGCTITCGSDCYNSNQGQPGTSQTVDNCNTSCVANCTKTCENNCNNYCASTCKTWCFSCSGQCSTECAEGCSGQCTIGCENGCATCTFECVGWCVWYGSCQCGGGTCTDICATSCGDYCLGSCLDGCLNLCQDTCDGGCDGSCQGNCDSCTDQCYGTCASCTNSCSKSSSPSSQYETISCSSCDSKCGSNCSGGCQNECGGYCTNACGNGCKSECKTTCSYQCSKNCAKSTEGSTSTSYGSCHNSCTNGCATSCNTYCVVSSQ